jgi:integrase
MARTPHKPKYCHHKPHGRGYSRFPNPSPPPRYVTVIWPGPHGTEESYSAYVAGVNDYLTTGRVPQPADAPPPGALTVEELAAAFLLFAREHGLYQKAGRDTSELHCLRSAFRPLCRVHGGRAVSAFGVAEIDALRLEMVGRGWAEKTVRSHLVRVRSLFAWGQERGLVPAGVRLAARRGLGAKPPRGRATERKGPPDPFAVGAVQLVASPPVRAMLWLQWLNGMRSAGVCSLRPCDVDRKADPKGGLWLYTEPPELAAKTGAERHWFGERARAILAPWLDAAPAPAAPAFRPGIRPGAARGGFRVGYYRRYVARLCAKLGVPHFHPHQLRRHHLNAVRRLFGPEYARARGGHKRIDMTDHYTSLDDDLAREVARRIG